MSCVLLLASTLAACGVESDYYGAPSGPHDDTPIQLVDPVQVLRVVDGDTVDVLLATREEAVRMKGVDTPELRPNGAGSTPEECAEAARAFTLAQIGTAVDLVHDSGCAAPPCRDSYNRVLAYVRLASGSDMGALLLRNGLARVYRFQGEDFDSRVAYEAIQSEATADGVGVWGAGCP